MGEKQTRLKLEIERKNKTKKSVIENYSHNTVFVDGSTVIGSIFSEMNYTNIIVTIKPNLQVNKDTNFFSKKSSRTHNLYFFSVITAIASV